MTKSWARKSTVDPNSDLKVHANIEPDTTLDLGREGIDSDRYAASFKEDDAAEGMRECVVVEP